MLSGVVCVVVSVLVWVLVRFVRIVSLSVLFIMNVVLMMFDVSLELVGLMLFIVVSSIGLNVMFVLMLSSVMLGSMCYMKLLLIGVCENSVRLYVVISRLVVIGLWILKCIMIWVDSLSENVVMIRFVGRNVRLICSGL